MIVGEGGTILDLEEKKSWQEESEREKMKGRDGKHEGDILDLEGETKKDIKGEDNEMQMKERLIVMFVMSTILFM